MFWFWFLQVELNNKSSGDSVRFLESEIEWFPLIRISYHFRKDIL